MFIHTPHMLFYVYKMYRSGNIVLYNLLLIFVYIRFCVLTALIKSNHIGITREADRRKENI